MAETITTDLCVIGAGAGGLSVAAAAGMLQVPTMLIEKGGMGGVRLNAGCAPSKALIAASRLAAEMRRAPDFGYAAVEPKASFAKAMAHVRRTIGEIAPMDSEHRFRALGCEVIRAEARFVDRRAVAVGDRLIRARRFVLAVGARPAIPDIPGLVDVPYLTHETLFDLARLPRRLAILGGGRIGVEMAQAFQRLGSQVTVIEAERLLGREDAEAGRLVRRALDRDGVSVIEGARIEAVSGADEDLRIAVRRGSEAAAIDCTHLLVAAGRRPALEGLGLESAGVAFTERGITVDRSLRTTNRKVYAIGDCAGPPHFTHRASHHAGLVIRNALFRLPVMASEALTPRVIFADPEIAAVGMSEDEAMGIAGARILRWPFAENDRAQAERRTEGFVKAMVGRKGDILGVVICGHNAGELLQPWTLAMANGLKIGALSGLVVPYPTYSEASKRAATAFLLPKLRSPALQWALGLLRRLG